VPHSDYTLALTVAHEAGQLLQSFYGKVVVSQKGDKDLVTNADRASEKLITDRLRHARPGDTIISEEGTFVPGDKQRSWIVDPLDGTNNFAHGFFAFAVSIALVVEGELKVGVVHAPTLGKTFAARAGTGATLNGIPVGVSDIEHIADAIVATGFPYARRTLARDNLAEFNTVMMEAQGVRRVGAASLDLCWVAAGRWDAFWELHLKPWDVAAGMLICREAGGRVTDFAGQPVDLDEPEVVASNGRVHDELMRLLNAANESNA